MEYSNICESVGLLSNVDYSSRNLQYEASFHHAYSILAVKTMHIPLQLFPRAPRPI